MAAYWQKTLPEPKLQVGLEVIHAQTVRPLDLTLISFVT